MATSTYGSPYVASSDLVSNWPTVSSSVADRIDDVAMKGNGVNAQTGTTYTFVLTDAGKLVTASNSSAQTYTIPLNSSVAYETGTSIDVLNISTGTVTLSPAGGVTLNGATTVGAGAKVRITKTGTDTWWSNVSGSGLTLIASATGSAVSSVSINGCFTTAFDFYRIVYKITGSAADRLNIRMRVSAADNTSANYARQRAGGSGTTADANRLTGETALQIGNTLNADQSWGHVDIYYPAVAVPTLITAVNGYNVTTPVADTFVGAHNVSTAYDGLTIYPATGTITTPTNGIRVYGLQNP